MFDVFKKKPTSNSNGVSISDVKILVRDIQSLETENPSSSEFKSLLVKFSSYVQGSEGASIVRNYPDKEQLSLVFSFLLHYLTGTREQKIEWAERSFYSIMEYLDNQKHGRQGQAEGFVMLFVLLCVGREYLKPRLQSILDDSVVMNATTRQQLFDVIDHVKGAQNVIDQFCLMATSGIRELGQNGIQIMAILLPRYNGVSLFEQTIKRTDLMRYDPNDVIEKMRFLRNEIAGSLK